MAENMQRVVYASVHMRNEKGEFISSEPIYGNMNDEGEVYDDEGNLIEVNPVPEAFYRALARSMHAAILDGTFVPEGMEAEDAGRGK